MTHDKKKADSHNIRPTKLSHFNLVENTISFINCCQPSSSWRNRLVGSATLYLNYLFDKIIFKKVSSFFALTAQAIPTNFHGDLGCSSGLNISAKYLFWKNEFDLTGIPISDRQLKLSWDIQ